MEETFDLVIRVPHPAAADYADQLEIEDAIVNRLRLALARTPIAGAVIGRLTFEFLEHVLDELPGDPPLTPCE